MEFVEETGGAMSVQIIDGKVTNPTALRARWDTWVSECAPGAVGLERGVGGVTPDGRGVLMAWFASPREAERNAGRPEQDAWWRGTEKVFDGPARFTESGDVTTTHGAPTPEARFVQLMRAKVTSRAELERIEEEAGDLFAQWRPDLLGAQRAWLPGGEVVAIDFFTSLEEARVGEQSAPPPGLGELFGQWQAQLADVQWFDLPDPWWWG